MVFEQALICGVFSQPGQGRRPGNLWFTVALRRIELEPTD